jgi:hypothetical protein
MKENWKKLKESAMILRFIRKETLSREKMGRSLQISTCRSLLNMDGVRNRKKT